MKVLKKNNKPLTSKILLLMLPVLLIFLIYSVVLAATQGTGPFASLLLTPGVNVMIIDDRADHYVTQTTSQARTGSVTIKNNKTGKKNVVKNATVPVTPATTMPVVDQSLSGTCSNGQLRCSSSNVEVCVGATWQVSQTCPAGCANNTCNPVVEIPVEEPTAAEQGPDGACEPKGWWNGKRCYYPGEETGTGWKVCSGEAPGAKHPYAYNAQSCPEDVAKQAPRVNPHEDPSLEPTPTPTPKPIPPTSSAPTTPLTSTSPYDCIQSGNTWHAPTSTCLAKPKAPLTCKFTKKCNAGVQQTCTIDSNGSLTFTSSTCELGCGANNSCELKPTPPLVTETIKTRCSNSNIQSNISGEWKNTQYCVDGCYEEGREARCNAPKVTPDECDPNNPGKVGMKFNPSTQECVKVRGVSGSYYTVIDKVLPASGAGNVPYCSQRGQSWSNNSVRDGCTWEQVGCGLMAGAMVMGTGSDNCDPKLFADELKKTYDIGCGGTGFDVNRKVLESLGYDAVPVAGSTQDIKDQIEQYAAAGIPVWINANIETSPGSNVWFGHHTIATGIDDNGNIILNDPWYGQNVSIPVDRIDIDCSKSSCPSGRNEWVVYAFIPPDSTTN